MAKTYTKYRNRVVDRRKKRTTMEIYVPEPTWHIDVARDLQPRLTRQDHSPNPIHVRNNVEGKLEGWVKVTQKKTGGSRIVNLIEFNQVDAS